MNDADSALNADTICRLANSFLGQEMYKEAIDLLQEGCKLYPENLTLKIQLGRTRDALGVAAEDSATLSPRAQSIRQARDIRANLMIGVGDLCKRRGEMDKAIESYRQAIKLNPNYYQPFFAIGVIYYDDRDYKQALKFLSRAKAFNPFHEDVCYYLSLTYFYLERYEDALVTMLDALILSGDLEKKEASPYQQKIQLLIEKFDHFDRTMRNKLVKERQKKFRELFDSLSPSDSSGKEGLPNKLSATSEQTHLTLSDDEVTIRSKLKQFFLLRNLDDKVLSQLAAACNTIKLTKGSYVYQEGHSVAGLYLIESGEVNIIKETPYGSVDLLKNSSGRFFGEDALLESEGYDVSAVITSEKSKIFSIQREALLELLNQDRDLALHFYWYFWKNLSFQIRQANNLLQSFFSSEKSEDNKKSNGKSKSLAAPPAGKEPKRDQKEPLKAKQKEAVFKEQGIGDQEMKMLTRFSTEQLYNQGESIFREGDPGDRLYVVAEGAVMISKHIENVGEEALAVLRRGEFFGEMSLVDGEPRSADAKAHQGGATVLVIKRNILKEILNMDTATACSFLQLLYRILNSRLHEIRDKIYQWKVMAGGF